MAKRAIPVTKPITDPEASAPAEAKPEASLSASLPDPAVLPVIGNAGQTDASNTPERQIDDQETQAEVRKCRYTVVSAIRHNGVDYAEGADIDLLKTEADILLASGMIDDE